MTHASTSMTYEFTARTDKGRVRSNNEDAVAVDRDAQVAILADGCLLYTSDAADE